jgi:hypothetical protein
MLPDPRTEKDTQKCPGNGPDDFDLPHALWRQFAAAALGSMNDDLAGDGANPRANQYILRSMTQLGDRG